MAQTVTRSRGPVSGTAVSKGRKRKPFLLDFYSTALGKKYVMAITGIIGIGFVIGHMVGNLKAYIGTVTENGQEVTFTASSCVTSWCRSCRMACSSGSCASC